MQRLASLTVAVLAAALAGCAAGPGSRPVAGPAPVPATSTAVAPAAATVTEAQAFVDSAEARLLRLGVDADRASWVQSTYITHDTELLSAQAREQLIGATVALANESKRFNQLQLP